MTRFHGIDLSELKSDVEHLYKTVYQGNGKPAIVNQITSIEHRLTSLEEKLDSNFKSMDTEISLKFDKITEVVNERFNNISYQITQELTNRSTHAAGKYQLRTGVFTAAIASLTTLGGVFLTHLLK